ncbi:MAG: LD-carboxypeptidase [Caldimicrobium sp.]|nr:LD-carboxypeptidase [Caldimicrobium sp.]MCX7613306.1 LD-carboxypeptidase [Caldimicrobium sp.]MDW8183413.1 LD-carboxypeptidase [Caldimicrobium sp.]
MERSLHIGIIRPSSIPDREEFERGLEVLKKHGIYFKIFVDFEESDPSQIAFLLYELLTCGQFSHLWTVRGGAGAVKLLPFLDDLFQTKRIRSISLPTIIGFSDVTALHLYFLSRFQKIGIHGPMIVNLPTIEKTSLKRLLGVLQSRNSRITIHGKTHHSGKAKGVLFGGNLSLVASLCGTPYFPKLESMILFIEDVGEKAHKLERSLWQVLMSISPGSLKGIIFGDLGSVSPTYLISALKEFVPSDIPVGIDFPFGHRTKNYPLLVGAPAELRASERKAILIMENHQRI